MSMESEVETPIRGSAADELRQLASIWADLQLVEMSLHYRSLLTSGADLYSRRALWEQAVVAYGRCFDNAKRLSIPTSLQERIAGDGPKVHQLVLRWRDKHVAHRIDEDKEKTQVSLCYDGAATTASAVRVRVQLTLGPGDEGLAPALQELVKGLKDRIWREWFVPLEARILQEKGTDPRLRSRAREFDPSAFAPVFVTINPSR